VFVLIYTIEGGRREGYDSVRHPVSSLALGPRGWVQRLNFTSTGIAYLGLAWGLREQPTGDAFLSPLVAAAGVGLLVSAAAQTDPVSGYPPHTLPRPSPPTREGTIHDLGALPVFLGIPAACVISATQARSRNELRWAGWSLAAASSALAMLGLSVAAFEQRQSLVRCGGLFQRAAATSCLLWLTTLAARSLRPTHSTRPAVTNNY
jgi:hypothetical protein